MEKRPRCGWHRAGGRHRKQPLFRRRGWMGRRGSRQKMICAGMGVNALPAPRNSPLPPSIRGHFSPLQGECRGRCTRSRFMYARAHARARFGGHSSPPLSPGMRKLMRCKHLGRQPSGLAARQQGVAGSRSGARHRLLASAWPHLPARSPRWVTGFAPHAARGRHAAPIAR